MSRLHESPVRRSTNNREDKRESRDLTSKSEEKISMNISSAKKHDDSTLKLHKRDLSYPERVSNDRASGSQDQERLRERSSRKSEIPEQMPPHLDNASLQSEKDISSPPDGKKSENKNHARSDNVKDKHKPEHVSKPLGKVNDRQGGASDTASEESEKRTYKSKERKRHRRSKRHEVDTDSDSYDSEVEERKEAKRRRKEEKKLRKEERRRHREERRRRKEERRAEKLKAKRRGINSSPSENEKRFSDVDSSDGEEVARKESRAHGAEPEKEQKKLEIELRLKALESFKAKKSGHH
ncbi:hypothetical protein CRG98_046890 [Punica granatum]|uniref:Uncharacterized protein n=1 Tax=Punica granatum TaxID=22663 RepID=A0A2I0HN60_PUNGR|nr:hypothetical protein CRG98_046890 [Punica granatum]